MKKLKFVPIIIIAFFIFTACRPQTEVSKVGISRNGEKATPEIKPLIDFFSLANKSVAEIEKIYGKPDFVDAKSLNNSKNGEYRIYNKSGERLLQVDYFKNKAVAFYFDIPKTSQTKNPEETLKLCGLNLEVSNAQIKQDGFWWDNPDRAKPFYKVYISKFNDSGLYYNCEVQIKL